MCGPIGVHGQPRGKSLPAGERHNHTRSELSSSVFCFVKHRNRPDPSIVQTLLSSASIEKRHAKLAPVASRPEFRRIGTGPKFYCANGELLQAGVSLESPGGPWTGHATGGILGRAMATGPDLGRGAIQVAVAKLEMSDREGRRGGVATGSNAVLISVRHPCRMPTRGPVQPQGVHAPSPSNRRGSARSRVSAAESKRLVMPRTERCLTSVWIQSFPGADWQPSGRGVQLSPPLMRSRGFVLNK